MILKYLIKIECLSFLNFSHFMRNYMAERSPNEPKISLSIAFRGMSEKGKYLSFKIVVRDAHI